MSDFDAWDSFYVIIGSAAGALIGLQFVMMTLVAERPPPRASEAGPVFSTPTIVHFSSALLLSALIRMPWQTLTIPAILLIATGLSGIVYLAIVAFRMQKQTAYRPDLEDKVFHVALPMLAYIVLAGSAGATLSYPRDALFGVGAATLLLLFIGIHNTWDSVSFMVYVPMNKPQTGEDKSKLPDEEKP